MIRDERSNRTYMDADQKFNLMITIAVCTVLITLIVSMAVYHMFVINQYTNNGYTETVLPGHGGKAWVKETMIK